MPILPTSWSSPATRIVATSSGAQAQAFGQEHPVPGDVLGVPLRVAVLRVDGEDQALEDVEGARPGLALARPAGEPDRVAAARLRLLEGQGRDGQERRHGVGVIRERAHAGAHGQGQALRRVELERVVDERGAHPLEDVVDRGGPSRPGRPRGARPARSVRRRRRRAAIGAGRRRRSGAPRRRPSWPYVSLSRPEVVDVDQRDAERRPSVPRARSMPVATSVDECPVVERAGQRVALAAHRRAPPSGG